MAIEPTLDLFVDNEQTPYYWMDVTLPSGGQYEIENHGTIPPSANAADEFHIDVHVQSPNGGNETIQIDLGELNIDEENGEIHIHLKDHLNADKGGGVVRAENAQESSRPFKFGEEG